MTSEQLIERLAFCRGNRYARALRMASVAELRAAIPRAPHLRRARSLVNEIERRTKWQQTLQGGDRG